MARRPRTPAQRNIVYLPLAGLVPALVNPKLHDDAGISASLDRFGVIEPIVIDERTGRLVSGHGRRERLIAARDAGVAPPEGVRVDPDDGSWWVPVVHGWRSRNDVEAEAALVAVNQLTVNGGWDLEMLAASLQVVAGSAGGLVGVGFLQRDVDRLAGSLGAGVGDSDVGAGINDKADGYAGSGVRSFVLDYPLLDFDRITRLAVELRRHRQIATNADLVALLASEACERAGIVLGAAV